MKGSYRIIIKNAKLHYEFIIKRNISLIRGDSGTGKSTLIDMIDEYYNSPRDSGINLSCSVPCRVIGGRDWKTTLESINRSIVFIDEENSFLPTDEFASAICNSDNYYVIVSRESFPNLPYSVEEIYGIRTSGKYASIQQTYNEFYRIYETEFSRLPIHPKNIIVEDSNAGFEFFSTFLSGEKIKVISASGKSNILPLLKNNFDGETLVIADGAAFGSDMDRVVKFKKKHSNIALYLPESFEWLILSSQILKDKHIDDILTTPENYIESKQFVSWERYFTELLTKTTANTFLQYNKSKLNAAYLNKEIAKRIINTIKGIDFNI